jgi:SAM-dependent methyltransferase
LFDTFTGYAPTVVIGRTEQQKYEDMWEHRAYAERSPGSVVAYKFLDKARPKAGDTILDIGCGSGKASIVLQDAGLQVTAVDFAKNCLDPWVRDRVDFLQHDVTKPFPVKAKWAFSADLLEHIPEEDVESALRNILDSAEVAFLQISCVHETWGELIGETLHLTVKPPEWWKQKVESLDATVLWRESSDVHTDLLVVKNEWCSAADVLKNLKTNVSEEKLKENVKKNIEDGWTLMVPHLWQDQEIMLVGGGPSLKRFEAEIRRKRAEGVPLVTTNGAYNWCIERGITPSAQVMVDARLFNKRFLEPVIPECKYLVASQCDPEAISHLPKDRTFLWHAASCEEWLDYISSVQKTPVFPVPGGSTVMLRAIMLLQVMGFRKYHIYGMDSCIEDAHHAYEQKENDGGIVVKVKTRSKEFACEPWMASQALEFQKMAGLLDDAVEMEIYGDGLISTIIRESAED